MCDLKSAGPCPCRFESGRPHPSAVRTSPRGGRDTHQVGAAARHAIGLAPADGDAVTEMLAAGLRRPNPPPRAREDPCGLNIRR